MGGRGREQQQENKDDDEEGKAGKSRKTLRRWERNMKDRLMMDRQTTEEEKAEVERGKK